MRTRNKRLRLQPDRYCPVTISTRPKTKRLRPQKVVVEKGVMPKRSIVVKQKSRSKTIGKRSVARSHAPQNESQPLVQPHSFSEKPVYEAPQFDRMKARFLHEFGKARRTRKTH